MASRWHRSEQNSYGCWHRTPAVTKLEVEMTRNRQGASNKESGQVNPVFIVAGVTRLLKQ